MVLLAESTSEVVTTATTGTGGSLPDYFPLMIVVIVILMVLAMGLALPSLWLLWKIIDKVTPGKLNEELLGGTKEVADSGDPTKPKMVVRFKPNVALAIVVAAILLGGLIGFSIMFSGVVQAVLAH